MNGSWATESLHPCTSFGRHVIWWVIARPHSSQRPGGPVNDYEGDAINTLIQLQMVQNLHGKEEALLIHAVKEESRHVYRASGLCVTMMPIPDADVVYPYPAGADSRTLQWQQNLTQTHCISDDSNEQGMASSNLPQRCGTA